MPENRYRPGDTVVLKTRALGNARPDGPGQVVSVLPEAQGSIRYRVRFPHESFERSISQDEIDAAASFVRGRDAKEASASRGGKTSWIDPSAIRIRK